MSNDVFRTGNQFEGLSINVIPDTPKMKLSPGDYVTPEFRKEIDEWMVSFFGVTNLVPDGTTLISNAIGTIWMNPRTFSQLQTHTEVGE